MSPHVRVFESAESFIPRIHDLHASISKQLQASNDQYKV